MKPSTAVELAGFGCLSAAAWVWQSVPLEVVTGLLVTGALLLFIGYAVDDNAAVLSLHRLADPVKRRRVLAKEKRAAKRAAGLVAKSS